jgi:hypothetical protein
MKSLKRFIDYWFIIINLSKLMNLTFSSLDIKVKIKSSKL